MDWLGSVLASIVRTSTPILYVAFGVLLMQSAGIMNMAAEGLMLLASFAAALTAYFTGSVWLGMLAAVLISGLAGMFYVFVIQEFQVDQIIAGLSFNALALGLTTLLNRNLFSLRGNNPILPAFEWTLLGFPLPVYLGALLVPLCAWFLYRTRPGLKIRATGESPRAVESVGLHVKRIRYGASLLGSLLIGFGGGFLTLGITNVFVENMVNGRGYIAMTAVTFGKFTPLGTLAAVVLFGAGDALQYRVQAANAALPYQFALMAPYVMTIVALVAFARNSRQPSSLGVPYKKSR